MWTRQELKEDSKALLKLNYWPFVLVAFIHAVVTGGMSTANSVRNSDDIDSDRIMEFFNDPAKVLFAGVVMATALTVSVIGLILKIFVFAPFEVGCKRYMMLSRSVKPQFGEMTFAFRNCYGNVVKTMFLQKLYIFLWSLLLVIPGIIKAYEYRMVPYLMSEYPDMASSEAFRISKEMMMGNKWDTFVLDLSFLGWEILSACTLGLVGVFYVNPYQLLTECALYLRLKEGKMPISSFV